MEYLNVDLNNWIETLRDHLLVKENNINELYNKYYSEINIREFNFERDKILASKIDKITKNSFNEFIKKYIIKNTKISLIKLYKY